MDICELDKNFVFGLKFLDVVSVYSCLLPDQLFSDLAFVIFPENPFKIHDAGQDFRLKCGKHDQRQTKRCQKFFHQWLEV